MANRSWTERLPEEDPRLQRLDVVGVRRISTLDVNGKPLDGNATRASMRMKVRDYLIRCTRSHARNPCIQGSFHSYSLILFAVHIDYFSRSTSPSDAWATKHRWN